MAKSFAPNAHPQMLSTINSTNPTPTNSTASATESYEPTPIIAKHHVHPSSNAFGNRLVDQYLAHTRFRRISPQRFWFHGLWQKPGQHFAVCGGETGWQTRRGSALSRPAPRQPPPPLSFAPKRTPQTPSALSLPPAF